MAFFKLGQRVKMARPVFPENIGRTGRIREFMDEPHLAAGMVFDCLVDWDDGVRDGRISEGYSGHVTATTQLEPIVDPGCTQGDFKTVDALLDKLREEAVPAGLAE